MTGSHASSGPTAVVAHVPDLMDRSKLAGLPGIEVTFVGDPAGLAAAAHERGATVVVVDLARPGVLAALAAGGLPARVVGFGSHVDGDLLATAREAGCTEVLPRSRFFGRLREAVLGP
jgi:hypothetical protein